MIPLPSTAGISRSFERCTCSDALVVRAGNSVKRHRPQDGAPPGAWRTPAATHPNSSSGRVVIEPQHVLDGVCEERAAGFVPGLKAVTGNVLAADGRRYMPVIQPLQQGIDTFASGLVWPVIADPVRKPEMPLEPALSIAAGTIKSRACKWASAWRSTRMSNAAHATPA